jgi:hypothetical protein
VDRQDEAMQEGEPRRSVKKRHDCGTLVEALLVRPPGLQRAAGNLKHLGRLTLGDALGFAIDILLKQLSAFHAIPALVTILIATLLVMDDGSHSYLLVLKPLLWGK